MRSLAFVLAATISTAAIAQDNVGTVLILDGSGSMWGQIDGTAKITIAQQAVGTILDDFPQDEQLGLTLYGHRQKGSCTDIETIVAPATGTAEDIRTAVNSISPLGKTPMTDAVIAAADALDYTSRTATVILVSDGVETCHPDPCAAARHLDQSGVNFTTHVIGFDVNDPDALAQMQCIADATGGRFLRAADAAALNEAIATVVAEPDTLPETPLTPEASIAAPSTAVAGSTIEVMWEGPAAEGDSLTVAQPEAESFVNFVYVEADQPAQLRMPADPGTYEIRYVYGPNSDIAAVQLIAVTPADAMIKAPATALAGETLRLPWSGPANEGDYLAVGPAEDETYVNFSYLYEGNPVPLVMPIEPGIYEIRYHEGQNDRVVFATSITIAAADIHVDSPATAHAGETLNLPWIGPENEGDYLAVGPVGEESYVNFVYLHEGNPAHLLMPSEPGEYEIRYHAGQDETVLLASTISLTPVSASLDAADTIRSGQPLTVNWDGPGYQYDFVAIGTLDDAGPLSGSWSYTHEGNPLTVTAPEIPGRYELRYFLGQGETAIASRPLTVTD
ncbi:vWA domain-containing protein [Yoonia maritima]|uniref:vWA domain-containing protein n=1 Tax=Yoonia maritima TaxID=1435347 RepID=UPI000D0F3C18|nr:VWA domain-containing protein [Yoonia maritima]